jgi:hypothetical protein
MKIYREARRERENEARSFLVTLVRFAIQNFSWE